MNLHYHKIEDIESISKMLKEGNLSSLEVGIDEFTKDIQLDKIKQILTSINEAKSSFKELFKKDLDTKILISLLVDTEKKLKGIYIKENKIESKFTFVKKEELEKIIDFPDFSKMVKVIEAIKEAGKSLEQIISLEELIQDHSGITIKSLEKEIDKRSRITINGWKKIQHFLSTILLVKSFGLLKQVQGIRADRFVSDFKSKGIIHVDEFGGIRLNEENLIKKILREE